jgi:hypothetical protein
MVGWGMFRYLWETRVGIVGGCVGAWVGRWVDG